MKLGPLQAQRTLRHQNQLQLRQRALQMMAQQSLGQQSPTQLPHHRPQKRRLRRLRKHRKEQAQKKQRMFLLKELRTRAPSVWTLLTVRTLPHPRVLSPRDLYLRVI